MNYDVYYFSQFITPVATVKVVVNSCHSLKFYSKDKFKIRSNKISKKFSIFRHYKKLEKILKDYE